MKYTWELQEEEIVSYEDLFGNWTGIGKMRTKAWDLNQEQET